MLKRRNRKNIALSLALLLLIALVAGCSKPSASDQPIKLALSPWPGWFFWYVVEEKGFFEEHGVNVELEWFPVYSDSLQALATGKVDANSQTLSDTLAPASKGIGLKAVLVNDNSFGGDAIVAKSEIGSIEELKGKTVATELGTVDHLLLLTALAEHGMSESDINYVNMTVNDAGPAFISGKTDASVLWEPFQTIAVKEGGGKVLFSSKETPGLIPDLLVFKESVVEQRPDDVQNIVNAWFDAVAWYAENEQEGLEIMARRAETDVADYRLGMDSIKLFSLEDNLKAFAPAEEYESLHYTGRKTAEFLHDLDMLTSIPDMSKVLEPKFVQALAER